VANSITRFTALIDKRNTIFMDHVSEHPLLSFFDITGNTNPDREETKQHRPRLSVSLGCATKRGCPVCRNYNVPVAADFAGASATFGSFDATYFSDFLQAPGFLLVSERVKNELIEYGIQGYVAHRVPISAGFDFALKGQPIPPYYLLEITGRFDLDRRRFDNFEGQLCPKCHIWKPTKGSKFGYGEKNLFPLLESWNGGDFLLQGNINSGALYCTKKVADLARAKKWTGFGIKVMSWGCPEGGRADLRYPDWYEDLQRKVLEAFPVINGEIHSPLDELRKRKEEGIAWPYPPPLE
jgi:hypothetical protein